MNYKVKKLLFIMIVMVLGITKKVDVEATEANVRFGSENYEVIQGVEFPVGIYIESFQEIGSYSVTLQYDSEILEYLSGGTLVENGIIYLDGAGISSSYKHMLSFRAIQSGETILSIEQASGIRPDEVANDVIFGDLPNAPIKIETALKKNGLKTIRIIGLEELYSFDPDVLNYSFYVKSDIENLEFITEPIDSTSQIYVSGNELKYGENNISVTVKLEGTEDVVYKFLITKENLAATLEESIQDENELGIVQPEKVDLDSDSESVDKNKQSLDNKNNTPIEQNIFYKLKNLIKTFLLLDGKNNIILLSTILSIIILFIFILEATKTFKIINNKYQKQRRSKIILDQSIQLIDLETDDFSDKDLPDEIYLENITMKFKMVKEEVSSLKEYFIRFVKGKHEYRYLTALNKISLSIKKGDVVGIVGTNGSGKSTLLKIISGALNPTNGLVKVDNKKVQLLTLGTGFDFELTAKENVYLNGAIIGYKKEYIDKKYEEIVRFAELEGFMEEKMKNFSSGMVSRLGFAIATMRETPEILILDEVLAVGDMFFRKKSEDKIKKMITSGSTVLIVSHSMDTILKTCNKAIWIEKGTLRMAGEPKEVCAAYAKMEIK